MSKITQYLNEHVLGEVTSNESVRQRFSRDGSVLSITPELVVHPRVTNDIRKVARFSWQLAEKGHVLPITVRGSGSDKTGAAIGKGVIVNTLAHLNNILYINTKSKDQFVHVQPGVVFKNLNDTLKTHGMILPTYPASSLYSTIGGAIANNTGNNDRTGNWVKRLEVVLANGDLIEASRISKHDLDKKKGLQTFEGEIYRKIDGIIEDNQSVIADKISKTADNTGYSGIAKVKERNGSFDLTPLFVGSQGTLGIMSEIVLRTDFYNAEESVIVATFTDATAARTAADSLAKLQPSSLELIDGELYNMAQTQGKKYLFSDATTYKDLGCVLFVSFNDYNNRLRNRKVKKTLKQLSKLETTVYKDTDHSIEELYAIKEVSSVILQPESDKESLPSLIDGASISPDHREVFVTEIAELANKNHMKLPISINWLNGVVKAYPVLNLGQVGDKQKVFKLITDYNDIVTKLNGNILADGAEGRLKANAIYAALDEEVVDIYTKVRAAFDPFGTLNPGVKQKSELKTSASQLDPDYSLADFAQYSPHN